ncbi:MAG TPA: RCC1 domain-containing protein, partial [Candidatus Baltobacteraceae bacterium]|nr:RCC1 domain-containing protein [Candidatus Baltobacteraceae bacterium]
VGLSNVMAIAAGDNHCVALLNNGTLVEWGDNADGQADVPGAQQIITNYTEVGPYPPSPSIYSVTNPPFIVKLIAAGGNHTMATIFSPLVQYPVNVSKDLLLIYNSSTNSYSSNVCAYYMAHRPMASTANHLGISCAANEGISWTNYLSTFVGPIVTWLSNNPTLRPQYVILFHDLPSRYTNANNLTASVQYDMNAGYRSLFGTSNYLPYWMPFVTSINMNGVGGTNDCIQYINKLTNIGTLYASGQPLLSPNPTVYTNTNWYFDDNTTASDYTNTPLALYAFNSVLSNGVSASSVDYQPFTSTNIITNGTNVAGYFGWGCDGSFYPDTNYVTDKSIVFSGASSWFLMTTSESFNGQRIPAVTQASFLSWYASNAFGGTNYSNTAVAGVAYVDEPYLNPYGLVNLAVFYGDWAAGKSFAISAWAGAATSVGMPNGIPAKELQAIGDPFITR